MENAKIIEIVVQTQKELHSHEVTMKRGEGDVLKRTLELVFKYLDTYKNEGIVDFNINCRDLPTHPFANLECDVKIKLNNGGMTYNEHYVYGPTFEKEFDLITTPSAFLKNGLDWFDYSDVEEFEIKVRRERNA